MYRFEKYQWEHEATSRINKVIFVCQQRYPMIS